MKGLICLVALAIFCRTPNAALADATPAATSTLISLSTIGVGAHGYDFLIGHWDCTNSAPYSIYDPLRFSLTYGPAGTDGTLLGVQRATGYGEVELLLVYADDLRAWVRSYSSADGSHGKEASQDTGPKIVWIGSEVNSETGATNSRETWTFQSLAEYNDLSEDQFKGKWKVTGNVNCRKA